MNQYSPISHHNNPPSSQLSRNYNPQNYPNQLNSYPQTYDKPLQNGDPKYENQYQQNPEILRESQLQHINNQMNVLEKDIIENNKQIRLLNNKITKSDFQHGQLKKLFEKEQRLKEKQQEFEQILMNNEFLKRQMVDNKLKQTQLKHSLGSQYQQIVEEKKRREKQQRQMQIQQESMMHIYNQHAIQNQHERKKQYMQDQKRATISELQKRQQARQFQKHQKQLQKAQYNQVLTHRNKLETQKDHVYRQYYKHFMQQQDKLQTIYQNKAMQAELSKSKQRQQQQRRQYETFQMKMARQNEEKLRKITYERQSLKNYLQAQIEQNNRRKAKEKEQEHRYQNQVRQYQVNHYDYENLQKLRKKQEQKRYDMELATQVQIRNRGPQNLENAQRSLSLGYNRSEQLEHSQRKTHNPVTNPIDFKIGITNPYIIKEYEHTKEKYMGDHNLKLRNLAMIGNNSLVNPQR